MLKNINAESDYFIKIIGFELLQFPAAKEEITGIPILTFSHSHVVCSFSTNF